MLTEPGVAVIRDTAGVGGADVVAGSRLELSNGRQGTVVLTRSPLCVVCLDDDGDDAGVDDATLALRRMALRSGESGGEADAFMVGEMENSVDVTKLAGRVVDAFGCAVDGQGAVAGTSYKIFQEGLEQAQMAPIDEFVSVGVPAIDLMTPLGKGQSVLYVGPPEARSSLRRLARVAVAAQSPDTVKIYAGLDEAGNQRSQKKKFWGETGIVAPRKRASAFASECEAVLCAHAAMAHGAEAMAQGKDALVVLDGFEPLVDLWTRSTSILAERFGAENVGLGDDSECRAFFSAVLQRAGNMQGGGSLTVVALTSDEPPKEEEVLSTESYTLDQFRAAGARKSIMDRLEALDGRGIAITDDILGKIGVAAPNTNKRPDAPGTKRRSEACEMLTSIGDAHVEVMRNEKGVCDVDASASLQRVGVGADVGTDTRPPALVTLGVGNRLRLELAAATNVERERVNEEEAADEQALVRAAAWRAALRVGADDPPRSLSSVCGVAVAVQQGLFDGVSAEDAAVKVDKLLAALPETSVDATKALSDADLSALKAAAVEALQA